MPSISQIAQNVSGYLRQVAVDSAARNDNTPYTYAITRPNAMLLIQAVGGDARVSYNGAVAVTETAGLMIIDKDTVQFKCPANVDGAPPDDLEITFVKDSASANVVITVAEFLEQ